MALTEIGAIFEAIASGLSFGLQRDSEANTAPMQSRAMAEINQQILADALTEVSEDDLENIRNDLAG